MAMENVVFDIETDGLLDKEGDKPALTQVHSIVVRDLDTNELLSATDASDQYAPIIKALDVLEGAEQVYAHNGIGFDLPALQLLYPGFKLKHQLRDTLVIARTRWAHIKELDFALNRKGRLPGNLIGSHSLKAWGYRLGVYKGTFGETDDWSTWTPAMQGYCEQDTLVTRRLIQKIRKSGGLSRFAIEAELELAEYLKQQEWNGWPFDMDAAITLLGTLTKRKEDLSEKLKDHFGLWVVPGNEFVPKRSNSRYGYVEGCPMTRIEIVEFNPASRHHIYQRLQAEYGWKPTDFTDTGEPQVSESILSGLDYPPVPDLVEYLMVDKRLGQLANGNKAWLKMVEGNKKLGSQKTGMQHIHHVASNVTITHRHRHSNPNVAQVPKVGTPYGKECRALFTVPPGWKLVGSDAAGLELRCLAHYMAKYDGGEYGQAILEGDKAQGTDIHTLNMNALGIDSRDSAKTFIYAYLYGAGDVKLGSILYPSAGEKKQRREGKKLRAAFEQRIPALGSLSAKTKQAAVERGWFLAPDGRRVYVRHQHAALNTLLQCAGSIVCKHWIVNFNRKLQEKYDTPPGGGWDHAWAALGWIHDEVQIAVREEHAEDVAEILVESIREITDLLGWRLQLDGDAQIGDNWSETH